MIKSLREGTKKLHSDIEKDNIANKIMDHSITLEEYKLLLYQNYIAYKAAEIEIKRFIADYDTDKTIRLEKDLKNLGVPDFNSKLDFTCSNISEAVGAAYVVEGSAMGGMLIGKELHNCKSLESLADQYFFNGKRSGMAGWNHYLKFLRSQEFTAAQIDAATQKAKDTFLLFQKAFNMHPSSY